MTPRPNQVFDIVKCVVQNKVGVVTTSLELNPNPSVLSVKAKHAFARRDSAKLCPLSSPPSPHFCPPWPPFPFPVHLHLPPGGQ